MRFKFVDTFNVHIIESDIPNLIFDDVKLKKYNEYICFSRKFPLPFISFYENKKKNYTYFHKCDFECYIHINDNGKLYEGSYTHLCQIQNLSYFDSIRIPYADQLTSGIVNCDVITMNPNIRIYLGTIC